MSEPMATAGNILLDAGTNELEVLVFRLDGGWFGVNVAKVREVVRPVELNESPHRHPSVLGMFNMRGHVLPVVDLGKHLDMYETWDESWPEGRIIVTEFNGIRSGFLVNGVDRIHRMSWADIRPAPDLSVCRNTNSEGFDTVSATTGNFDLDGELVLLIDFESVSDAILSDHRLHVDEVENEEGVDRGSKRVVLAEDSPFMRSLMKNVLTNSGYKNLEVYPDGLSAWNAIRAEGGQPIDAIISDIEMPRMDGLHLSKCVKSEPRLKDIPLVLFSSLVSADNIKKGKQVGADIQIPKPELADMVRIVDRAVSGERLDADYVNEIMNKAKKAAAAA